MTVSRVLLIILFITIAVSVVVALSVSQVIAQEQSEDNLAERLDLLEIPVIEVTTLKRVPYEISIRLQSSSIDDHLTLDDNWFMQLTRREAVLSYRYGPNLKSYALEVLNTKDEVIHSEKNFLYPTDISQQLTPLKKSKLNDEETKKIVASELSLFSLVLKMIEVNDDYATGEGGQVLLIEVVAPDLETANNSINSFMGSVMRITDTMNTKYGTSLILCHVRLVDSQGNVLLDYVKNVDTGSEQWTKANGLIGDWFPHPVPPPVPTIPPATSGGPYPPPLPGDNTPLPPYPNP